ncbi:MAG TPA: hypothetical protein VKQ72_23625 [Aggregatilineales bacterium]|nr:hypothetical protein [Aggregatilineales bacterium]
MPEKDYSQTPLVKKLGIKSGARVLLVNAPRNFLSSLEPLPDGVEFAADSASGLDVIVLFVTSEVELWEHFVPLARRLLADGGIWVAWPKKSAKTQTNLTFDAVQTHGLENGLVDNKICAIDEPWTSMRFVIRLKDREKRSRNRES